jgi:hypothetical protein
LFSSTDMLLLFLSPFRTLAGQTLPTDEYDASYRRAAHALSTGNFVEFPFVTRVNKGKKRKVGDPAMPYSSCKPARRQRGQRIEGLASPTDVVGHI